jgi:hypothetical protein
MRLFRRIALVATIGFTLGCHDVSAPPGPHANYLLTSINGRSLPTFYSPIPEAGTVTYGTLFLDGSGDAVVIEHRREMGADVTYTLNYTYTISENTIQFDYDCPPYALCPLPPKGVFLNSHLLLDMSGGNNALVYDYKLVMED